MEKLPVCKYNELTSRLIKIEEIIFASMGLPKEAFGKKEPISKKH